MTTFFNLLHKDSEQTNEFTEKAFNLINSDNDKWYLILVESYTNEAPELKDNQDKICNHFFVCEHNNNLVFKKAYISKTTGNSKVLIFTETEFEDEIFTIYLEKEFINNLRIKIKTHKIEQNINNFK